MRTLESNIKTENIEEYSKININNILKGNKKIVSFLGTCKSGTSFVLNNLATMISSEGIDVAILDTTKNKDTYYLYTKNEETLKSISVSSIEGLTRGEANGIKVNSNLTVYTALPGENKHIKEVEKILETLLKKHSLILIDCDFETPINYFVYSKELFLVQTMDVLTIQPFTEFLSMLKDKGALEESKLRIIINKYLSIPGLTEREVIGALSYYNDPTMSYMKELFNKNLVKYITIPFEKYIYEKYLQVITSCEIKLEGYPYNFMKILKELSDEIHLSMVNKVDN